MAKLANWKRAVLSSVLAGASFIAIDARAQTGTVPSDAADRESSVDDIVVTAQRREERLLDVPISITLFTGDDIAKRGVSNLSDLQASVPGLRIVDVGPGSQRIQLRGISQYLGLPTVGNYIDEFSINTEGASGTAEVRLLDIERVEVLRGPQPALYGEGSMGGTIRYVTTAPHVNEFSGSVLGEVSTVENGKTGYRGEAVINVPIATDTAAFRLAAAHERLPGWTDGVLGRNLNDQEITTIRGRLLVTPTPALSISLLGLYNDSGQNVKSYSLENRTTAQTVPSVSTQRYYLGNLVMSYDFGPLTLLSSTGYLDQKSRSVDDSVNFYNTLFGAPLLANAITDSGGTFKRWAQEMRLSSNGSGPLRYLVGASYSDAKSTGAVAATGLSLPGGPPAGALGVVFNQGSTSQSRVLAAFGSVSYDLTAGLTIDLGGRYFRDKRSVTGGIAFTGIAIPPSSLSDSGTFDSFNPRINMSLKTGKTGVIYVNAAKGFRSGGFNLNGNPAVPRTFGPEKLWSYELGTRQSVLGGQLLFEAAIYYNNYKNIQATVVTPGTGVALPGTRNAGEARGPGFDLSFTARPDRNFSFSGTLGWSKVEYKTLSTDRFPGDPLDLVPEWTWSAAVDYTPRLNDRIGLLFHADAGFTDAAQITLRNLVALGFAPAEFSESRAVVNLRAGVTLAKFDIYVFANNVLDENRIVNPSFGAFFEETRTRPRTLGIGVRGRF